MSEAVEKLKQDLEIMEAMAAEMDDYLRNQALFYPLEGRPDLPRLTLGGYLLRQHRLTRLRHLLDEAEQARLEAAVSQFNKALVEKVVAFENRAHQELHARLRQWSEYLKELRREHLHVEDYYASSVETRAMIEALLDKLRMPPYELDERILDEVRAYDNALRNQWRPGDFVWFEEWKPAYPRAENWWLYGQPRPVP